MPATGYSAVGDRLTRGSLGDSGHPMIGFTICHRVGKITGRAGVLEFSAVRRSVSEALKNWSISEMGVQEGQLFLKGAILQA